MTEKLAAKQKEKKRRPSARNAATRNAGTLRMRTVGRALAVANKTRPGIGSTPNSINHGQYEHSAFGGVGRRPTTYISSRPRPLHGEGYSYVVMLRSNSSVHPRGVAQPSQYHIVAMLSVIRSTSTANLQWSTPSY